MKFSNPLYKRLIVVISAVICSCLVVIALCYLVVSFNAKGRTFDNVDDVPHNRVGLLLGTSPFTKGGSRNHYFENRIKVTEDLYKAGKIDVVIASGGDYSGRQKGGCNELTAMRDSLVARGVPVEKIVLDYEGTRTLNSIAKLREVYQLDSVTVISQKYHNERALFLSDSYGLHAVGFNAEPSPLFKKKVKNIGREFLARVKLFIDYATGCSPSIDTSKTVDIESLKTV